MGGDRKAGQYSRAGAAGSVRPYLVRGDPGTGLIVAWSGYPLQFGEQRRFAWQDAMAVELRQELSRLPTAPGAVLAGRYLSTDQARCDMENRLFTNPGASSFPKSLAAVRFERGTGPLHPRRSRSPAWRGTCITTVTVSAGRGDHGSLPLLARWQRVTRRAADDGSCRPVWLAMKTAATAGQVEILAPGLPASAEFGVRVIIHATSRGPRQAATVSETVVDGIIAAFHAGLGHGRPHPRRPQPLPRGFPAQQCLNWKPSRPDPSQDRCSPLRIRRQGNLRADQPVRRPVPGRRGHHPS